MVATNFSTLPDGFQFLSLFDQAFAQCFSGAINKQTGTYTLQNSDASGIVALDGSAFYTFSANAVGTYSTPFMCMVSNIDGTRGKTIAISGITNFILWPQQSFILYNNGTGWTLSPRTQRWQATGDITLNVDPVLGNNNNDGLSTGAGNALQTIEKAALIFLYQIDIRGQNASIILADGTYTENGISVFGLDGALLDLNIGGSSGHGASVLWNIPAGQVGMQIKDSGAVTFSEITISGGTGAACIQIGQTGIVDTEPSVTLGNCPSGTHFQVFSGGSLNINGHVISGTSYAEHIVISGSSNVTFSSAAVSLAAATFSYFIYGVGGASITAQATTFTGVGAGSGSTGQKFLLQGGASFFTNVRNPNSIFPGATNGVIQLSNSDGGISAIPSYGFTNIPGAGATGMFIVITDSTTNTWGATVTTGGGTNVVLSWYNGSNWTVTGK